MLKSLRDQVAALEEELEHKEALYSDGEEAEAPSRPVANAVPVRRPSPASAPPVSWTGLRPVLNSPPPPGSPTSSGHWGRGSDRRLSSPPGMTQGAKGAAWASRAAGSKSTPVATFGWTGLRPPIATPETSLSARELQALVGGSWVEDSGRASPVPGTKDNRRPLVSGSMSPRPSGLVRRSSGGSRDGDEGHVRERSNPKDHMQGNLDRDTPPPASESPLRKVDSENSIQQSDGKEMEDENDEEPDDSQRDSNDDEEDDQDEDRDEFQCDRLYTALLARRVSSSNMNSVERKPSREIGPESVVSGDSLTLAKADWLESGALEPNSAHVVARASNAQMLQKSSYRRDASFDFSSRYILNKPFRRLRDMNSALELDLLPVQQELRLEEGVGSDALLMGLKPGGRNLSKSPSGSSGGADVRVSRRAKDAVVSSKHGSEKNIHGVVRTSRVRVNGGLIPTASIKKSSMRSKTVSTKDQHEDVNSADSKSNSSVTSSQAHEEGSIMSGGKHKKRKGFKKLLRRRNSSSSNGSGGSDDGQEAEEEAKIASFNVRVYLNAAAVFALFITDLIFFLVFELFWIDSVCTVGKSQPMTNTTLDAAYLENGELSRDFGFGGRGAPDEGLVYHIVRWEIVIVKAIINFFYFFKVCTIFAKMLRGQNMRLLSRWFLSRPVMTLWMFLMVMHMYV